MITDSELRNLIRYNPMTGLFFRPGNDKPAGSLNKGGYVVVSVAGRPYYAHRLAWLYVNGKWPDMIDHINGDRSDNRIANLRSTSVQVNQQNIRKAQKNSKSGFLGVIYHKDRSAKYSARIHLDGKFKHLGYFTTPEEAYATYVKAKRDMHVGNTL